MKGVVHYIFIPALLGLLLFSSLPSLAGEHKHLEDFGTTRYKDAANTTAWWDTVAGQLKLFPFAPTRVGMYHVTGWAMDVAFSGRVERWPRASISIGWPGPATRRR